jgi:hypothetical protein
VIKLKAVIADKLGPGRVPTVVNAVKELEVKVMKALRQQKKISKPLAQKLPIGIGMLTIL